MLCLELRICLELCEAAKQDTTIHWKVSFTQSSREQPRARTQTLSWSSRPNAEPGVNDQAQSCKLQSRSGAGHNGQKFFTAGSWGPGEQRAEPRAPSAIKTGVNGWVLSWNQELRDATIHQKIILNQLMGELGVNRFWRWEAMAEVEAKVGQKWRQKLRWKWRRERGQRWR